MTNYDNKLGAWFKNIEKISEEFQAKKKATDDPQDQSVVTPPESTGEPTAVEVKKPLKETSVLDINAAEESEIVANVITADEPAERTGQAAPRSSQPVSPQLFDETDVPQVEDFLSFLERPRQEDAVKEQSKAPEEPVKYDIPKDEALLNLPEGTGEPRPVSANQPVKSPEPVKSAEAQAEPKLAERAVSDAVKAKEKAASAPVIPDNLEVELDEDGAAEAKWDRLPQQLQALFNSVGEEVAQNSYKTFKESRASLIQRLLDPPLTLEETARILNVCPTTVRRYTNRGVLKHYRTVGNQRRFKLSDVLSFMEDSGRTLGDS